MSIVAKYNALPRAAKWGVLACAALVAYFGVVEPALNAMNRWISRADTMERELAAFAREREARKGADDAAARGVTQYGIVDAPGDPAERSAAFNRRIAQVLEAEGIKQSASTSSEARASTGSEVPILARCESTVIGS